MEEALTIYRGLTNRGGDCPTQPWAETIESAKEALRKDIADEHSTDYSRGMPTIRDPLDLLDPEGRQFRRRVETTP